MDININTNIKTAMTMINFPLWRQVKGNKKIWQYITKIENFLYSHRKYRNQNIAHSFGGEANNFLNLSKIKSASGSKHLPIYNKRRKERP